jgi:hypothetical protein
MSAFVMGDHIATPRPVSHGKASQTEKGKGAQVKLSHAQRPLSFEPNFGQSEQQVKFLSRGNGYKLFLTADQAVLMLKKSGSGPSVDLSLRPANLTGNFSPARTQQQPGDRAVLEMR